MGPKTREACAALLRRHLAETKVTPARPNSVSPEQLQDYDTEDAQRTFEVALLTVLIEYLQGK